MVAIAQQVEHLIVVQKVARSNRVGHPHQSPELQGSGDFQFYASNASVTISNDCMHTRTVPMTCISGIMVIGYKVKSMYIACS